MANLEEGFESIKQAEDRRQNGPQNSLILLKRYAHLTLTQKRTPFLAKTPSAFALVFFVLKHLLFSV